MNTQVLNTTIFVREYEEHSPALYNYMFRATGGNEHEADDLVQEAFLRAWKSKSGFEGKSSIKSWFFTIGINIFREKIRRKKLVRYVDEVPEVSVEEQTPIKEVEQSDLRSRITEEIDKLPQEQKDVFNLIRVQGYSYSEAAEELDSTVCAVRMRLHRANETLSKAMQDLKEVVL